MKSLLIETCCATYEDALESAQASITRIELNSALALGGLTPSVSLLKQIKRNTSLKVMAMLRPREGGMCYSNSEFQVMLEDLDMLLEAGTDGIVTGVLCEDGSIDFHRTEILREKIGSKEAVFHRAFDLTPNPFRALDQLIELGFHRILTSGQQADVIQGERLLMELRDRAKGAITILPGGGLRSNNVIPFLRRTSFGEIHYTPRHNRKDRSSLANLRIDFGLPGLPQDEITGIVNGEKLNDTIRQYLCEEFQEVL